MHGGVLMLQLQVCMPSSGHTFYENKMLWASLRGKSLDDAVAASASTVHAVNQIDMGIANGRALFTLVIAQHQRKSNRVCDMGCEHNGRKCPWPSRALPVGAAVLFQ